MRKFLLILIFISSFAGNLSAQSSPSSEQRLYFEKSIKKLSPLDLIETLKAQRVESIYYEAAKFPVNVQELISRPGMVSELSRAYGADKTDPLFRFNIILIFNHKKMTDREWGYVAKVLDRGLLDSSEWVRVESVWGLGRHGDKRYLARIMPLLDDQHTVVVNETILTVKRLLGDVDKTVISNQYLSDEDRKIQVEILKGLRKEKDSKKETIIVKIGDDGKIESKTISVDPIVKPKKNNKQIKRKKPFREFSSLSYMPGVSRRIKPIKIDIKTYPKKYRRLLRKIQSIARTADRFIGDEGRAPASKYEIQGYEIAQKRKRTVFKWGKKRNIEYIASPDHWSFTINAYDKQDKLLLSYHVGAVENGLHFYPRKFKKTKSEPIGWAPENLLWTKPWETNSLGYLVADAIREAANADFSFVNAYALRGNIPSGPVYKSMFKHVLPFPNKIVTIKMKGRDIIDLMKRGTDERWFLYACGVYVTHNNKLGTASWSVTYSDGSLIESDRTYKVATLDYLVHGGDGFVQFESAGPGKVLKTSMRQAVIRFFRNHVDWKPNKKNRVTIN